MLTFIIVYFLIGIIQAVMFWLYARSKNFKMSDIDKERLMSAAATLLVFYPYTAIKAAYEKFNTKCKEIIDAEVVK